VKCLDCAGSRDSRTLGNLKEYRERRKGGREQPPFALLQIGRQPSERRYFVKSLTEKGDNKELNQKVASPSLCLC